MTEGEDAAARLLKRQINDSRELLLASGAVIDMSGNTAWSKGLLCLHSDYGPAGQDKAVNQDYALAWVARDDEKHPLRWAAALADGVTSSFRPEWGAKLACWRALAELLTPSDAGPEERARQAIDAAGLALGELAMQVGSDDQCRPAEEFPATWCRRIERGRLLQTTLTLAWLEEDVLNVAMVGDGGGALRMTQNGQRQDMLLVGGEQETAYVHALGPANQRVEELDCWKQCPFEPGTLVALYTDGIRSALGKSPASFLDQLSELLQRDSGDNTAEMLVGELASGGREELKDNLTLFVASKL